VSPLAWAQLHPVLLALLLMIASVFGGIVTVVAILWAAPDEDLLRDRGLR
jgi:hypothetical protein